MTLPTPNRASGVMGREEAHDPAAASSADSGPFVLNLCSSTTPMALAQNDLPELKRFTFFVSRRFEEGRERFRLHMGYFTTLAEAEEWLNVVREIYPGAWAGEAPGKKLRARAAAAAAAQAQHAVGPQPRSALPNLPPSMSAAATSQAAVVQPTSVPRASAPVRSSAPPPAAAVPVARPVGTRAPAFEVPTVHAAKPAQPPVVQARPAAPPVLTPAAAKSAASPRLVPPSIAKVGAPSAPAAAPRA